MTQLDQFHSLQSSRRQHPAFPPPAALQGERTTAGHAPPNPAHCPGMMQWVPGPRRPRRKTAGIRDWGRVWPPTLKVVSTRAAPSSQPGSTSFTPDHPTPAQPPNASATAQANDHKASEPHPQPREHTKRQPSRRPLAFPPSAGLPAERQPNRQTPALQRKRTTTRQANPAPRGDEHLRQSRLRRNPSSTPQTLRSPTSTRFARSESQAVLSVARPTLIQKLTSRLPCRATC